MKRRRFLTAAATAAVAAPLAAPRMAKAQDSFNWRMTNSYGPGSPFYVEGPGSPTDFIEKVASMSGGRLTIQHFAAGELIPALEGFDAVQQGVIEMNASISLRFSDSRNSVFVPSPWMISASGSNSASSRQRSWSISISLTFMPIWRISLHK